MGVVYIKNKAMFYIALFLFLGVMSENSDILKHSPVFSIDRFCFNS